MSAHLSPTSSSCSHLLVALKACNSSKDLQRGRELHAAIIRSGHHATLRAMTMLMSMYAKCGSLKEAHQLFNDMHGFQDTVSWTVLILGYANNGQGETALQLFSSMVTRTHCQPNEHTFLAAVKACQCLAGDDEAQGHEHVKLHALQKGMAVHRQAFSSIDIRVENTLIDMYSKCRSMHCARRVFDQMESHDTISWTVAISGYADSGEGQTALSLLCLMQLKGGCAPDTLTFVACLKACTRLVQQQMLLNGMAIHSLAAAADYITQVRVANTLVDMYAKCGRMTLAVTVLQQMPNPTPVAITALMLGYAEEGACLPALHYFSQAALWEGCQPDALVFVAALKACGARTGDDKEYVLNQRSTSLQKGLAVHGYASSVEGCSSDIRVASALVDLYSKCGSMVEARRVFDQMRYRDVVCWTALIFGYAESGQGELSLDLYSQMRSQGCSPGSLTFAAALKACAVIGSLEAGKAIYNDLREQRLQKDPVVAASLVSFYGKCGCMAEAQHIFDSLATKELVMWNALMTGYSRQGDTQRVIDLFQELQDQQLRPDSVTFLCLLSACNHAGLVDKGKEYFESMVSAYGVARNIEHYHCLVDMLGRANEIEAAVQKAQEMPYKPKVVTWNIILGACRKWKNVELGRLAFESLLKLDDKDSGAYVVMASIYGSRGMCEEQSNVEAMRLKSGLVI